MAKILITGGTGLIGLRLKKTLIDKNHEVIVLTREPKNNDEFMWDLSSNYIDEKALENTDYIIHLAIRTHFAPRLLLSFQMSHRASPPSRSFRPPVHFVRPQ